MFNETITLYKKDTKTPQIIKEVKIELTKGTTTNNIGVQNTDTGTIYIKGLNNSDINKGDYIVLTESHENYDLRQLKLLSNVYKVVGLKLFKSGKLKHIKVNIKI